MNTPLLMMLGILAMGMLLVILPVVFDVYARYRRRRLVTCPETQELVEVQVDTRRTAWTAAFGKVMPRVKSCSLWPRKKGCEEDCVKDNWPPA